MEFHRTYSKVPSCRGFPEADNPATGIHDPDFRNILKGPKLFFGFRNFPEVPEPGLFCFFCIFFPFSCFFIIIIFITIITTIDFAFDEGLGPDNPEDTGYLADQGKQPFNHA